MTVSARTEYKVNPFKIIRLYAAMIIFLCIFAALIFSIEPPLPGIFLGIGGMFFVLNTALLIGGAIIYRKEAVGYFKMFFSERSEWYVASLVCILLGVMGIFFPYALVLLVAALITLLAAHTLYFMVVLLKDPVALALDMNGLQIHGMKFINWDDVTALGFSQNEHGIKIFCFSNGAPNARWDARWFVKKGKNPQKVADKAEWEIFFHCYGLNADRESILNSIEQYLRAFLSQKQPQKIEFSPAANDDGK